MANIVKRVEKTYSFVKSILDTSALVKLILYPDIKEQGGEELEKYRKDNTLYTLDLCVGEALNVLKQKAFSKESRRKVLTLPEGYLSCITRLTEKTNGKKGPPIVHLIQKNIQEFTPLEKEGFYELVRESIRNRHEVDFADAMIICEALKPGYLLITADKNMAATADSIGVKVWNCNKPLILGVENSNSKQFHIPTCVKSRPKSRTSNIDVFSGIAAARTAGYVPCEECKPAEGVDENTVA